MKKRSICSHIITIYAELRSFMSNLETSLIISLILFHRKSKICRNSILLSPGGNGKAKSFSLTLSASTISLLICSIACIRPFFDRGMSFSSSYSSPSALLVDLRYLLRVKAKSGSFVFLLISKMAKDRPVSNRITPSSRLLLLVWNVSNLSLNSSLPHMVAICCMSKELLDSGSFATAGTLCADYEREPC